MHKILVIDDDESFTDLIEANLRMTGEYFVKAENDSTKALGVMQAFDPDVVLLDIVMPGLDGGELLAQIEADPELSKVPIILVSALVANEETTAGAVAHSANRLIVAKPVKIQKLVTAIEHVLTADPDEA